MLTVEIERAASKFIINKIRPFTVKNLVPLMYRTQSVYMTAKAQYTTYSQSGRPFFRRQSLGVYGEQFQNYHTVWIREKPWTPLLHQEIELCREQNYSFRILNYKHRQEALSLLAEAFDEKEPITESFNKKHPELKGGVVENWASYWDFFIDDLIDSGLSVAVFDSNNSDEMIGIVVAKDYKVMPSGYEEKFMSSYNVVSQMMGLASFMIDRIDADHQDILKEKAVIDLFGGTIKEKHVGKKIFSKILELNVALGREKGYDYAFTYVTNFKSELALKKLEFEKVGDYDCSQYLEDDRRPFQLVEEMHRNPSIWLKMLE